jgi:hypothetical protein
MPLRAHAKTRHEASLQRNTPIGMAKMHGYKELPHPGR